MATRQMRDLFLKTAVFVAVLALGCAPPPSRGLAPPPPPGNSQPADQVRKEAPAEPDVSVADARAFIERTEKALLERWIAAERASWVKQTNITHDTAVLSAKAHEAVMGLVARVGAEAVRYDKLELPVDLRRKLKLLKLSLSLPAPRDAAKRAELARVATEMDSIYGKGKVCSAKLAKAYRKLFRSKKIQTKDDCLSLGQLSDILAKSRKPDELLLVWREWRKISRPMRPLFERYVELGNLGARELGFADLGALWRSRYDMRPDAFKGVVARLWSQLKPFYEQLHCYARARLQQRYGKQVVPDGPIPAHLMGNMWAQDWVNIKELLLPEPRRGGLNLERALKRKKVDEREMVRYAERFFVSLGMAKLPESFWKRSMFVKPRDREVVCHASAWDIDFVDDLRIKMCIKINGEDFTTIHHELGHNYYQYYYRHQPALFRDSANDGFHEGIGDTISLSVTPAYLVKLGLLRTEPKSDLNTLMERALEKIAFLPFGMLMDRWRWQIFSGKVTPASYNESWWQLRRRYQGFAPPVKRGEADFDPGAKYHIPGNVPYTRYFLAHVLQFQFHRALCKIAGHQGPLHKCSIYGNKAAGARLKAMLEMGLSQPWTKALETLSGETKIDVSAILDYFQPLHEWLKKQNQGRTCGW